MLLSYHGDKKIKEKLLDQVLNHQIADEITKGVYWQNGLCDIIGAATHTGNHTDLEIKYGIPHIVGRIADRVFETLPEPRYKTFPHEFYKSIPVGIQMRLVPYKFFAWFISGSKFSLIFKEKNTSVLFDLKTVADYIQICIERKPLDKERAELKKAEKNLKALSIPKENFSARSCYNIICLFRDMRQAWACTRAIEMGLSAYVNAQPEIPTPDLIAEYSKGLAEKLLELVTTEK